MEKLYKYRLGKRVIYSSLLYIIAFIGLSVLLAFIYEGGYISAWFISLILAVLALMILSIPRRVVVDEEGIEIQCIAEDTTLLHSDIANIRKVEKREMNACLPIFGAVGFFGHYGRFLNLQTMEFIHIYASRWGKFVEITDIDGNKYYISCEERDDIIKRVGEFVKPHDTQENI
ncbi:MAG: hypothetical protein J6V21_05140 [Alistipes sp.]|jgi:hypothetical protein|nr:hypothetical protein [Alistipes sp.]